MHQVCIVHAQSMHRGIIYASSMNRLCVIYVLSVYHHILPGSRLGGIWEASRRHLEASAAIWKHFEAPGSEEGDYVDFQLISA